MITHYPPIIREVEQKLYEHGYCRLSQLWVTQDQLEVALNMAAVHYPKVLELIHEHTPKEQMAQLKQSTKNRYKPGNIKLSPYGEEMTRLGFVRFPKLWVTEREKEALQRMAENHVHTVNQVRDMYQRY